jgi:hypothetical protein
VNLNTLENKGMGDKRKTSEPVATLSPKERGTAFFFNFSFFLPFPLSDK